MKPTSGEKHVAAFARVRSALESLNELVTSGDLNIMTDDDVKRIVKARAQLAHVRYAPSLRPGNPKAMHG